MQRKNNIHSQLRRTSITIVIILLCIAFLSSCVMRVRTRDHDNGRHRGERHDGR